MGGLSTPPDTPNSNSHSPSAFPSSPSTPATPQRARSHNSNMLADDYLSPRSVPSSLPSQSHHFDNHHNHHASTSTSTSPSDKRAGGGVGAGAGLGGVTSASSSAPGSEWGDEPDDSPLVARTTYSNAYGRQLTGGNGSMDRGRSQDALVPNGHVPRAGSGDSSTSRGSGTSSGMIGGGGGGGAGGSGTGAVGLGLGNAGIAAPIPQRPSLGLGRPAGGNGDGSRTGSGGADDNRRESVYLPIDTSSSVSPDASTWPFDSSSAPPGFIPSSPSLLPPPSPSTIHPSYGAFSSTPPGPVHQQASAAGGSGSPNLLSAHQQQQQWSSSYPSGKEEGGGITTPLMSNHRDSYDPHGGTHHQQHSHSNPNIPRHQSLAVEAPRPPSSYYPPVHSHNGQPYSPRTPITSSTISRLMVRLDTPTSWLVLYFLSNLGLTLYNKFVLVKFPFAWTLTGIHTLCGAIGAQACLAGGLFQASRLTRRENGVLIGFSILYTINIAVSNLSLNLVSVPFHQVVRAMTPLFTVVLSTFLLHKHFSSRTYLALVPVILGVVFATFGDYSFTTWGFILTLLGTVLAALKTVATNMVMVGRLKLHPLDLLLRMSPLAFVQCVIYGWYGGELEKVREYGATQMTREKAVGLLINGMLAFLLNVVSFTANKKTSALTMTVAANVKQVLTIVLAVMIFNLTITPLNFLGISLTLFGGAMYARVELQDKAAKTAAAAAAKGLPNGHVPMQMANANVSPGMGVGVGMGGVPMSGQGSREKMGYS